MHRAVFFDIGDTLGVPAFNSAGTLTGIECFPFVKEILTRLRDASGPTTNKLGIISNTPAGITKVQMNGFLTTAGILEFFPDPDMLLYSSVEGMDKTNPAFFTLATTRAGLAPNRCVFVGESDAERTLAKSKGLRVSFHPLHLFHVLAQM
jgi:FMN phosphatase YigB (HAD superfamily)